MMNVAPATAFRISSARVGRTSSLLAAAALALAATGARAAPDGSIYYRCPDNVFTNTLTPKEADARGCKAMESHQPTTIPAPKSRPAAGVGSPGAAASRVDAQEQKARDTDSRKILQDELIKAQAQLDALQKEYNNGQPERKGDEKNFQKYLDRAADLKASIARTESDINAITRELAKTQ
jgi:predicted lipid-binding transport protein (Tim44 family)